MSESKVLVPVKGHAGIYKRGGSYVVRYRDPAGKSKKQFARTLAQARAIRAEVKTDIDRGEYRANSKITFGEYAETWKTTFTGRTSNGIRPDTLKRYRADLDAVIIPVFGRYRLAEIEPQQLKKFTADLFTKGLSESRVRNIYAPLRALLRTAVEEGVIRYDATAGVRIARVRPALDETDEADEKVVAYTDDELGRLLAATPEDWKLFVRFLAQTGLRISEALALRWSDIDFGQKRTKVTRRLYRGSFAPPKTKYGRRQVPLAADLARDLWQARKMAVNAKDEAPVFATATGGYLDYQNVYGRVLAPTQKKLGLATGAHVLRHTCATMLFKHDFNAKQVQVWMGHHSPSFTLSVYVHLLPDDLPEAPEWGSALGSPRRPPARYDKVNLESDSRSA